MKQQILGKQKEAGKEMLRNGVLPWWAVLILIQHSGPVALLNYSRHSHRCSGCGQILICHSIECKSCEIHCGGCFSKLEPRADGDGGRGAL